MIYPDVVSTQRSTTNNRTKKKKYVCGRVVTGGREFEYKADRGTEIASRARQRARNTRALVILDIRVGGGVHGVS